MNVDAPAWLVDWLTGVSLWDAVLWVAAAAALVLFIQRKGWRWIIAFARAILATAEVIDHVRELPTFIEQTNGTLQRVTSQLENSHITNLRDDVTEAIDTAKRVEEGVLGLHGRMDVVESDVKALRAADDEFRAELEDTRPPHDRP